MVDEPIVHWFKETLKLFSTLITENCKKIAPAYLRAINNNQFNKNSF